MKRPIDAWEQIESKHSNPGNYQIRLDASSGYDLFATMSLPKKYAGLRLDVSVDQIPRKISYPSTNAFRTRSERRGDITSISISLENVEFLSVFGEMCWSITRHVSEATSQKDALRKMIKRINMWRSLFEGKGFTVISVPRQVGLFGELLLFERLLNEGVDAGEVLSSWKGPTGEPHDFHLENGHIEVKTSTENENKYLRISGLRQLTPEPACPLFLWVEFIEWDVKHGRTLATLAGELCEKLGVVELSLRTDFELKLAIAGYLFEHSEYYNHHKGLQRRLRVCKVVEDFPCLRLGSLPESIVEADYKLDVTKVSSKFDCSVEEVFEKCFGDVGLSAMQIGEKAEQNDAD